MLKTFIDIWNNILQSNLFNFVVMLIFLGWIIKKFDIADMLDVGRKNIEDRINNSKIAKENSIKTLFEEQSKTKETEKEVFDILEKSDKNAKIVGKSLVEEAERQAAESNKNLQKTIDNNIKSLKLNLSEKTANAAINLAKKHIEDELMRDKTLHLKFINESIDALNGVKL